MQVRAALGQRRSMVVTLTSKPSTTTDYYQEQQMAAKTLSLCLRENTF